MTNKKLINSFLICFFSLFFLGQTIFTHESKKNSEQKKQEEILKPAFEVEVVVTNIDVVVTDKKGRRVTGLKPENFEIYEDRLLQKLTNFYEVKGMEVYTFVPEKEKKEPSVPQQPLPKKPPPTQNKIIIYFDNWHLHPMNRNWSIKKLESFIRKNFSPESPNNQGMVVCLGQKIETLQEFTSNQWELLNAINQAKKYSGQSLLQKRTKEDMRKELNRMISDTRRSDNRYESYDMALGFARSFVESEQNDLSYSLKSLSVLIDHLAGIEGKKMLIYVSDGLPINPGEEVFSFIDSAFGRGRARTESMNYDATDLFKELTARCNTHEIGLYPINARGLESMALSADQEAGWNTYSRGSGMAKATSRYRNDALKLMARDTGGLAILNTNDIASGLKMIEDDLQFYYSIGYVSPQKEDNKYHSIEVKLVGVEEKYDVRVQQGYMRASQAEKIKEGVFSRLFLNRQYNPMNIKVQILTPEQRPGTKKLRLTLKILIPIKNITLYPQKDMYIGQIKTYISLKDSGNRVSPCHELTEKIEIPAKDYEIAMRSNYPYLAEMYVDPDHYIISLAVKDVPTEIINYLQLEKTIK